MKNRAHLLYVGRLLKTADVCYPVTIRGGHQSHFIDEAIEAKGSKWLVWRHAAHQSPTPSQDIWPWSLAFLPLNPSCFVSSYAADVSSMWEALKKLQSHFEISWQKIECHPKHSLGFKHPCQSQLSSPGDFYPNNRSLWCAWPEGLGSYNE